MKLKHLACIFIFAPSPAVAVSQYTITALGNLGGAVTASSINDQGQVAGTAYLPNGSYHAYTWSTESGIIDLGALPGDINSNATSINNSGWVTGTSQQIEGNSPRGFLWRPDVGSIDIGAATSMAAQPSKVTETGVVIGRASPDAFQLSNFGFTYSPSSGMSAVTIGGSPTYEVLTANNSGDMVVTVSNSASSVFVSPALSPIEISNALLKNTVALDMNNSGTVVGYADNGSSPYSHAFQWSQTTGLTDLTPAISAQSRAYATAINDFDQIVGFQILPDGSTTGFLWDQGYLYDLSMLVGVESLAGWDNLVADDINSVGQIAGYGKYNGQTRAFLLTPARDGSFNLSSIPEPTTLTLLALATLPLLTRRRKTQPAA